MSTTIDQRVVEMRFDNKQFESGVKSTMSTLDKFKQKLNFTGASKGMEGIASAANNTKHGFKELEYNACQAGFSLRDVWLKTSQVFEYQVANKIVQAGKNMAKALTIDPIKTGLQEYETQINSVQTILANTESKGSTLDDVNSALEELNKYADKTIYNFTEMTRNIGTFTAAGVDLDTSVNAIQGIANLAAISGSSSQQASTAMYQLSQALASGTVKLMDWNSVVNAGMGGEVFQNALKETARVHGVAIDDMIEKNGSFRETLKEEWLTSEILTETLMKFTMATEGLTDAEIEANRVKLKSLGYTDKQIDSIFKLGNTATNAATKVKTFTQLWDVLKEAAQSGWSKTWKLFIGDFEEAKETLSPLADYFTEIINKSSDSRNNLLESALTSNWDKMITKLNEAGVGATDFESKLKDVLKKHGEDVEGTIEKYGSLKKAFKEGALESKYLKEAFGELGTTIGGFSEMKDIFNFGDTGDNVKKIQAALNELGFDVGETGVDGIIGKYTTAAIKAFQKEKGLKIDGIVGPETLAALDEATKKTNNLGDSLNELADGVTKLGGRDLIIESFKNIGKAIEMVVKSIGKAWGETFESIKPEQLYGVIEAIHRFTTKLTLNKDQVENLVTTFKGLFAALDIVLTLTAGPLKIAFEALKAILGYFNIDILEHTANIGQAVINLRDWIDENVSFTKIIENVAPALDKAVEGVKNWIDSLKGLSPREVADSIIEGLKNCIKSIKGIFSGFGENIFGNAKKVGGDFIDGFKDGVWEKVSFIGQVILELGKSLIDFLRESIDSHSPSRETKKVGNDFVMGFVEGIKEVAGVVWDAISSFGSKCIEILKNADLGSIVAAIVSAGLLTTVIRMGKFIGALASPLQGLGDIFGSTAELIEKSTRSVNKILKNTAKVVKSFSKVLDGVALSLKADALKDIAIAIAILVGSVVALTFLEPGDIVKATITLALLGGMLAGLFFLIDLIGSKGSGIDKVKDALNTASLSGFLLSFSISLLIMVGVLKLLGSLDPDENAQRLKGLAMIVGSMAVVLGAFGLLVKGKAAQNIKGLGKTLLKISIAMLLLVGIAKIISMMDNDDLIKGGIGIIAFGAIIAGLVAITRIAGKHVDKMGSMLLKTSIAMLILVGIAKILGGMSKGEIIRGGLGIAALAGVMAALVWMTKLMGKDVKRVGSTLLGMSASMLILIGVAKLISKLSSEEIIKGGLGIIALGAIMAGLIKITTLAGGNLKRLGGTLLMMSVAIGILAGVAILLSLIKTENLVKGVAAVAVLGLLVAAMTAATKGATNCVGNLVAISIAIAIMATAVAALSMIDGTKLGGATIALGVLMGMFALIIKSSKSMGGSVGALIVMTVAIGLIGILLYSLAKLPIESTISSAVALSVLLLAVSASLAIVSKFSGTATNALMGVLALTAMAIPLLAFVGILALMQNIQNATKNAIILGTFVTVISLLLIPLTIIGSFAPAALFGVLALTAMAIPLLAFVGILALMEGLQNATANANLLIGLMTIMTTMLIAISLVAPLATIGVIAMTGMVALVAAVGVFATGVGALMEKFPKLEEFLNKGLPLLEQIATAIGNMIGNFIGGALEGITNSLPTVADNLTEFMNKLGGFIEGAKTMDEQAVTGAKNVAVAIMALTAADFINGISQITGVSSGLPGLGSDLSKFMSNASGFITSASGLSTEMTEGVKALAETILILTAADVIQGIASLFGSEGSLDSFGSQLPTLGQGLAGFAASIAGLDMTGVEPAANAVRALAKVAQDIPNTGGLLADLIGDNDMATWAASLPSVGTGIAGFVGKLQGLDLSGVDPAANAIKTLAKVAQDIPNTGGLLAALIGDNDMATWATSLPEVGKGLSGFASNLGTFTDEQRTSITCAANAIVDLSKAADKIPNEGGWISKLVGDNSIGTFAGYLPDLGSNLGKFAKNIGTFDPSVISTAVSAIEDIVKIGRKISEDDWFSGDTSVAQFGKDLSTIGSGISLFVTNTSTVDIGRVFSIVTSIQQVASLNSLTTDQLVTRATHVKLFSEIFYEAYTKLISMTATEIIGAINKITLLTNMTEDVNSIDVSGLSSFGNALADLGENIQQFSNNTANFKMIGTDMIDNIISGISSRSPHMLEAVINAIKNVMDKARGYQKNFKTIGVTFMDSLAVGITSKTASVISALTTGVILGVNSLLSYYSSFYNAGSYLVDGFAAGISANAFKAQAKAAAMARAALRAAEAALKIKSPSRAFYKVGDYAGQGFVNALGDYCDKSYLAGSEMADSARVGLSNTISRIRDFINGEMNTQPTIRPVLDLSDVQAGAGTINSIFGNGRTFGVMGHINAISSSMNQNGRDNEVVTAINKLAKHLDNVGGTSYNINGVTYDDGSNISNAVQSIVRAAMIERRT